MQVRSRKRQRASVCCVRGFPQLFPVELHLASQSTNHGEPSCAGQLQLQGSVLLFKPVQADLSMQARSNSTCRPVPSTRDKLACHFSSAVSFFLFRIQPSSVLFCLVQSASSGQHHESDLPLPTDPHRPSPHTVKLGRRHMRRRISCSSSSYSAPL